MVVTYVGALVIFSQTGKKRFAATVIAVALLASDLFVLKYVYNLGHLILGILNIEKDISWLSFVAPIGISYFTLSAIGYLMEVYWGNCKAEKNLSVVALFVSFYPQIISGPISRFKDMSSQFKMKHSLEYDNVRSGSLRMLWGYFKKLVISDRVASVVQVIYGSYEERSSFALVLAMILYAIQLYTDFSGCMDIIVGVARSFGIVLPENFKSPFFSCTISEFWRRWHITLGAWFKDFVMYPVLKTKGLVNLGKRAKKTFGKKYGKKIPTYLSLIIVWFLLGLWHGGVSHFFISSALIPCTYLILGDFFEPQFDRIKEKLKINKNNFLYLSFQRVRTFTLIGISWIFISTEDVFKGLGVITGLFANYGEKTDIMALLAEGGIGIGSILILSVSLVLLWIVDYLEYKEKSVIDFLDKTPLLLRWGVIYFIIAMVFLFGKMGESSFIYFKF